MPLREAVAGRRFAQLVCLALTTIAFELPGVCAKSALIPIKRRDGGLHSRDLLQNATVPLHGAVRDYGYDP